MSEFQFGGDVVWRPSDGIVAQSRLRKFMDRHGIASLEELQRRSTEDIEWFWTVVLRELGIEFYRPYECILDASRGIAWPRWCCGGKMNIVHNCLDKWHGTPTARREAIRRHGERGCSGALHAHGAGDGGGIFCCDQNRRNYSAVVFWLRSGGSGRTPARQRGEVFVYRRWILPERAECAPETGCR